MALEYVVTKECSVLTKTKRKVCSKIGSFR